MKIYHSLVIGLVAAFGLTSCNDYLDINDNPDNPNSETASYEYRLPWVLHYSQAAYDIGASVDGYFTGLVTTPAAREGGASRWNLSAASRNVTIYQWFYVTVGPNLQPLYDKAMAAGAYHYAACAKLMRAFGFMNIVDHYGEMPYTEAFDANAVTPKYDTDKTIFMGCMDDLEDAISLFKRTQEPTAQPLSVGDTWNNGDVSKWLKFCYLLKARWLNHLSKKAEGSWRDGKYDQNAILAALDSAQTSNSDNTVLRHTDTNGQSKDVLWGETVDYSEIFSCIGMNVNRFYVTKMFYDDLTNFAGNGVEDPRADKFIPWVRSHKGPSTPASIKWSNDGLWRRSLGVDIVNEDIFSNGSGPYPVAFTTTATDIKEQHYTAGSWYCNADNKERFGDTVYVQGISSSKGVDADKSMIYRYKLGSNRPDSAAFSGTFSVRPSSPTYLGSYWEACFIRAEVLMRRGDRQGAYDAYKKGVEANIEAVEDQCSTWVSGDESYAECPSFAPASQEAISNFLNNGLGTAADLTMGKIMTQKIMSMFWSTEQWNDMRRFDYDPQIFLGWGKPRWYLNTGTAKTYCPEGSSPRRLPFPSQELSYNVRNLEAIGAEVPGAEALSAGGQSWYNADAIRTLPVWWDRADD